MNIEYIDLRKDILAYKLIGNVIYANEEGKVYKVDFSNFKDGEMINNDISFLAKASKENGELFIILRKPVDKNGIEIPQDDDFSTDEYEEVLIKWKTKQEIDDEELLENLFPTEDEIKNAELEIAIISLLQDLEMI